MRCWRTTKADKKLSQQPQSIRINPVRLTAPAFRMRFVLCFAALCLAFAVAQEEPDCVVGDFDKVDCGFVGSDENSCTGESQL